MEGDTGIPWLMNTRLRNFFSCPSTSPLEKPVLPSWIFGRLQRSRQGQGREELMWTSRGLPSKLSSCKSSSLRPFLFIGLPGTPVGRVIWGGGGKHSIFNCVNQVRNVHAIVLVCLFLGLFFFFPFLIWSRLSACTEEECFWEA